MPNLSSDAPAERIRGIPVRLQYFGLLLFMASFFLPAVGMVGGFECAFLAIFTTPWQHDDKISSLAAFGGWLNPELLLFFCLSILRCGHRLRSVLTIAILFSIPMTWIALYRMNDAGMALYPLRIGHFLWIAGILLIVLPDLPFALRFASTRRLAVLAGIIIAVVCFPIAIGLTMRAPTPTDDSYYDLAWSEKNPAECGKIDPDVVGRPDQRDSWDFTYMQSDCYRNVAAMLHEPRLCEHVKSGGIDRIVGSIIAKSKCRSQEYTIGSALPGTRSSPYPFQR